MSLSQRVAVAACRRTFGGRPNNTLAVAVNSRLPSVTTTWTTTTTRRGYRGDSGEATPSLSPKEQELLRKGKPIYDAIRERHVRPVQLKDLSPQNLQDLQKSVSASDADLELEIRRKRLIYRSKQRGWLEVDVLLGTWASEHVPTLKDDELDQFEDFVNMETIDIYNIITLRLDVPENMKRPESKGVVERIQEWARSSPLGKADPLEYKKVKESAKLI